LVGCRVAILVPYSHAIQKGESIDVLTKLGCEPPCDGESSVPPSYTPSSSSQPTYTTPASEVPPSSSSSPAPSVEKIQKNKPAPSPVPTEPASTTTATSTKETTSTPPPAQTPSNDNDNTGGQYVLFSLFYWITYCVFLGPPFSIRMASPVLVVRYTRMMILFVPWVSVS
jgi:hypothetical protein